jgi:hypothetical protein
MRYNPMSVIMSLAYSPALGAVALMMLIDRLMSTMQSPL